MVCSEIDVGVTVESGGFGDSVGLYWGLLGRSI